MNRIASFLDRRSRATLLAAAVIMVTALGLTDYYLGREVSSSLLYLVPIAIATWYIGPWPGILVSALSSIALFTTDILWRITAAHLLAAIWNTFAPLGFFLAFVGLLTLLKRAFTREEELARTDPLTGLNNRRYFHELAASELARAHRYSHPMTLAYMDLDNFKAVNDTFGHDAGDELLKQAADLLRGGLRSTDIVARLGGDEFAVLLPEGGAEGSALALSKFRETFLEAMSGRGWPVSVSIGAVTFVSPPGSLEDMLRKADSLMYEVKSGGRNEIKQEVVGR